MFCGQAVQVWGIPLPPDPLLDVRRPVQITVGFGLRIDGSAFGIEGLGCRV